MVDLKFAKMLGTYLFYNACGRLTILPSDWFEITKETTIPPIGLQKTKDCKSGVVRILRVTDGFLVSYVSVLFAPFLNAGRKIFFFHEIIYFDKSWLRNLTKIK